MSQRELMESSFESKAPQTDGLKLVEDAYGPGALSILKAQNVQDRQPADGQKGLPLDAQKPGADAQKQPGADVQKDGDQPAEGTVEDQKAADFLKKMENPSPAVVKFNETYEKYSKAPDKAKAMEELGPKFDESIQDADKASVQALKESMTEGPALAPKMQDAKEEIGLMLENVGAEIKKLPEADRPKVMEVMTGLLKEESKEKEQELLKELEPFPRVQSAVEALNDTLNKHEPMFKRMEELGKNVTNKLTESAALRMGYSELLEESGNEEKAEQMEEDAASVLKLLLGPQKPQQDQTPRFMPLPLPVDPRPRIEPLREA